MSGPDDKKRGPRAGKPRGTSGTSATSGEGAAPEGDRIAKVLARRGIASRRAAEAMIAEGRVTVNGRVIDSPALNVTERDRITLDGAPLPEVEPSRLWLYYKPQGLVTTEKDEKGRPTVFESLPPELGRVVSVGRLDLNSEGLLLLTNDGALKRRLELPSTGWLRKYRVRVHGEPNDAMLEPLRAGVTVDGERFLPMEVTLDRQQGANAWLTVGLREGRNREVRRAMESVGLTVNRLIRISYGPFRLAELKPGEVEEVRRKVLREQLGLAAARGSDDLATAAPPAPARAGRPAPLPRRPGGKPAPRTAGAAPEIVSGSPGKGLRGRASAKPAGTKPAGTAKAPRPERGPKGAGADPAGAKPPRGGPKGGPRTGGAPSAGGGKPRGPSRKR